MAEGRGDTFFWGPSGADCSRSIDMLLDGLHDLGESSTAASEIDERFICSERRGLAVVCRDIVRLQAQAEMDERSVCSLWPPWTNATNSALLLLLISRMQIIFC